jgi:hypothetical protein
LSVSHAVASSKFIHVNSSCSLISSSLCNTSPVNGEVSPSATEFIEVLVDTSLPTCHSKTSTEESVGIIFSVVSSVCIYSSKVELLFSLSTISFNISIATFSHVQNCRFSVSSFSQFKSDDKSTDGLVSKF